MDQTGKARAFAALHAKGDPLILYNIWDAGSAKAVAEAGASAIATGSWSVAAAQGFEDGQKIPLELLCTLVQRIVEAVDLPVTVDIEGGYGTRPEEVAQTAERVIGTGAVGINFEDQIVGGEGLYGVAEQAERIAAIRQRADRLGLPLFINARTDLFLKQRDRSLHPGLLAAAEERAKAYEEAGANGFFAPGLLDDELIAALCEATALPLNILLFDQAPPAARLAEIGVRRISHGPLPYRSAMARLREVATERLHEARR